MMNRSQKQAIILVAGLMSIIPGCGGAVPVDATSGPVSLAPLASTFKGAQSLEKSADGFWVVKWDAIAGSSVVYSVYKAPRGTPIDYEMPFTTAQGNHYAYRPKNQYSERAICFAVRVSNVDGDKNTSSVCSDEEPIAFGGARSLKRLGDGSYILEWSGIPVENVIYAVYERQNDDQFTFDQPSFDGIQNVFFGGLSRVERGTRFCYVVRYQHPDLLPDTNTKELCTEVEPPIEFAGIGDLKSLGGGKIKATWVLADQAVVKSYRIYQGSDFREVVATVASNVGEATIEGLVPGRQYSIGVRALDAYQREDRNIRIRAIVIPTE